VTIDIEELIAEAKDFQSTGKRPRYSREFKRKTVSLLQKVSKSDLAEKLGISPITIDGWRRVLGPRNKKKRRPGTIKNEPHIDFVPILPSELISQPDTSAPLDHLKLEFKDNNGKQLSISLPWHQQMAGSLFQFIGQTMNGGIS